MRYLYFIYYIFSIFIYFIFVYYLQVENGWLEPLLVRIIDNPKRLVCPVIENINYQDFSLEPVSSYLRGTVGKIYAPIFHFFRKDLSVS